jgi:hypothetical protein
MLFINLKKTFFYYLNICFNNKVFCYLSNIFYKIINIKTIKPNTNCYQDTEEYKNKHNRLQLEQKYLEKFNNLVDKQKTDDEYNNYINNFIIEYTSFGNIIIHYNFKINSFVYYSDKQIVYDCLDKLIKKYCIKYDCKILSNITDEINDSTKNNNQNDKQNNNTFINKNKHLFANLKNYQSSIINKNKETKINTDDNINVKSILKKVDKVIYKTTRGGLFNESPCFKIKQINHTIKPISFKDFKNKI